MQYLLEEEQRGEEEVVVSTRSEAFGTSSPM